MRLLLFFWGFVLTAGVSASPWQSFTSLAISADGAFLATGGLDGEVLLWESSTGEVLSRWLLPDKPVVALSVSAEGCVVLLIDGAVFSTDPTGAGTVSRVAPNDTRSRPLEPALRRWLTGQTTMAGVRAERLGRIVEGFPDGRVTLTPQGGTPRSWQAHGAAVTGLVWSPDGRFLYSSSYEGSLAVWDDQTGRLLGRL